MGVTSETITNLKSSVVGKNYDSFNFKNYFYYNQSIFSGLIDFRKELAQSSYFLDVNTEAWRMMDFPNFAQAINVRATSRTPF